MASSFDGGFLVVSVSLVSRARNIHRGGAQYTTVIHGRPVVRTERVGARGIFRPQAVAAASGKDECVVPSINGALFRSLCDRFEQVRPGVGGTSAVSLVLYLLSGVSVEANERYDFGEGASSN